MTRKQYKISWKVFTDHYKSKSIPSAGTLYYLRLIQILTTFFLKKEGFLSGIDHPQNQRV